MTGFKKAVHPAVEMTVKARLRVDLQLEVGDLSQSVEIEGDAGAKNRHRGSEYPDQQGADRKLAIAEPALLESVGSDTGNLSDMDRRRRRPRRRGESVVVNGLNSGQNKFILDSV